MMPLKDILSMIDDIPASVIDDLEIDPTKESLWDYQDLIADWLGHGLTPNKKKVILDIFDFLSNFLDRVELEIIGKEILESVFKKDNLFSEELYDNCCFILKNVEWLVRGAGFRILKDWLNEYVKVRSCVRQIECEDLIVNRPCYLKLGAMIVNLRHYQGSAYYDVDNRREAWIYVFSDAIESISDSHMSIPFGKIIGIKLEADSKTYKNKLGIFSLSGERYFASKIVSICCRNAGNINFFCDNYSAAMLLTIVPQIMAGNVEKMTADIGTESNHVIPEESAGKAAMLWVGPDYLEGIAGMKVLVVGDCRCQDVSEWNEGYVADVIGNKFLAGNSDIPAYNILTKIGKALAGKVVSEDERNNLWNRLIFCNFFQEPVTNLRNASDGQIEAGQKAFLQVLEKYAPDRVIACEPLYGYLPNEGRQGPEVTLSSPWKDGKIYSAETWIYPLPYGKECKVMPIANPGGGFPWDYWHELIVEFLK